MKIKENKPEYRQAVYSDIEYGDTFRATINDEGNMHFLKIDKTRALCLCTAEGEALSVFEFSKGHYVMMYPDASLELGEGTHVIVN